NYDLLRKGLESFPWPAGHDETSKALARYAPLRAALPAAGAVGYIIDLPASEPERAKIRRRCRYALAPCILVDSPDLPLVVSESGRGAPSPLLPGYEIAHEVSQDLRLLRKTGYTTTEKGFSPPSRPAQFPLVGLGIGLFLWPLALWPWLRLLPMPATAAPNAICLWRLSAAWGLGTGLAACAYYAHLVREGQADGYCAWDLALAAIIFAAGIIAQRRAPAMPLTLANLQLPRVLQMILVLTLLLAAGVLAARSLDRPHGEWDAQKIWNYRAIFLAEGGARWRDGFSPLHAGGLPDYPPLIPCAVARLWLWQGGRTVSAPMALSLLFTAMAVASASAFAWLLCSPAAAALTAIALAASAIFLQEGAAQQADVPVAFFLVTAFGNMAVAFQGWGAAKAQAAPWLMVSSMTIGWAAWTKNEGIALFLALSAILALSAWQIGDRRFGLRAVLSWLVGASLPLLALGHFKYTVAPANEIIRGVTLSALAEHLFNLERHLCIWRIFLERLCHHGQALPLAVLALAALALHPSALVRSAWAVRMGAIALALIAAVYYGVYLISPYELPWHVSTSLERLLAQLWPLMAVWLCNNIDYSGKQ
ncbi:MAG: hypothetical protein N3A66_07125, partial [Planctomycetota bacterium]|nr:hypothetical protein [Planctomycetota bacterium]